MCRHFFEDLSGCYDTPTVLQHAHWPKRSTLYEVILELTPVAQSEKHSWGQEDDEFMTQWGENAWKHAGLIRHLILRHAVHIFKQEPNMKSEMFFLHQSDSSAHVHIACWCILQESLTTLS